MKRYIDTDLLSDEADCLYKSQSVKMLDFEKIGYNHGVADVIAIAKNLPTADVRENVYAENVAEDYDDCDQFVCSNCGIELQDWLRVERDEDDGDITYSEYVFKFCPNCGADIRERREDET